MNRSFYDRRQKSANVLLAIFVSPTSVISQVTHLYADGATEVEIDLESVVRSSVCPFHRVRPNEDRMRRARCVRVKLTVMNGVCGFKLPHHKN